MRYFKYLRQSLEHRVRTIWFYLFVFFSGVLLMAIAARCYVLEPRNVDIIFNGLRRLGVPIQVQGAYFEWKWAQKPHLMVKALQWGQGGKEVSMTKASAHFRFSLHHPLHRFACQELGYAYKKEQNAPSTDYLVAGHALFSAFKVCSLMEACHIERIRITEDQKNYLALDGIFWDTQDRQKLIGRIHTPKGDVAWSYCPKVQLFSAQLVYGVQRVLNDLGYTCSSPVPIVVTAQCTPKNTHITIGWDASLCTLDHVKHTLHKGKISLDCRAKDVLLRGGFGMDGLSLSVEGDYHRAWQLSWKSQGKLSIRDLKAWWNKNWALDARDWVATHFNSQYGDARTLYGKISGTGEDVQSLYGAFDIVHALIHPVPGIPEIQKVSAHATFDLKHFHFAIQEGVFSKQKICSGSINIADFSNNTQLVLAMRLEGSVADVVHILGCKRLDVAKDIPVLRPKGSAYTSLRMRFPLTLDLQLSDIVLDYESGLEQATFDLTLLKTVLAYEKGKIYIKGSQHEISIEGTGRLDRYPAKWSWKGTFGPAHQNKLMADVWINPVPWLPKWCKSWVSNEFVPLKVDYVPEKKRLNAVLDLRKTAINIPWINWKKSSAVPLSVECTVLDSKQEAKLTLKGAAKGEGSIHTGAIFKGWGKIYLPNCCNAYVKISPQARHLDISAQYIDVKAIRNIFSAPPTRAHAKGRHPAVDWYLKCNVRTLQWDKEHILKGVRGTIRCKQRSTTSGSLGLEDCLWHSADIHATIRNKKTISAVHILAQPRGQETGIKCIVKELSALSSLCGLEKILRSAESGEWIGFQRRDRSYHGRLMLRGVVTKGLLAVKLLSLFSPTAVTELLHSSLDFAEILVDTVYKNNTLYLTKGIAKGLNLGGFLSGKIDVGHGTLFLKGGIVPAYILNTILSRVPLIGALLGEEKGIISTQFVITGTLDDPNFLVNPLSMFEVGGLKALFE